MVSSPSSPQKPRLTLAQLTAYDDILTDALVDHVYYWTSIRKNRSLYHPSRGLREEEITSIVQKVVIIQKDAVKAEQQLLALPGLQKFLNGLKTPKEKEDFRNHLRRYIKIYLPDCPFEVSSTNRYTLVSHEAAVTARRLIKKGEAVKYLCGVQVVLTTEEEAEIAERRRDFSIVISSRNRSASLFLGPARFANHDCDANARLITTSQSGMQVVAARDIECGEEITVTYGDNYFGEDNCECLCFTCEQNWRNGWEPADGGKNVDAELTTSIEADSGGYSLRRNRKLELTTSSRTPSATPDIRPRVSRSKKLLLVDRADGVQISAAVQVQVSPQAPERTLKRKRVDELRQEISSTPKKNRAGLLIKAEDDSLSRVSYSTPESSPENSIFDQSMMSTASHDVNNLTDITSGDDETIVVLPRKKSMKRAVLSSDPQILLQSITNQAGPDNIIIDQFTENGRPESNACDGPSSSQQSPNIGHIKESSDDLRIARKLKHPTTSLSKALAKGVKKSKKPRKQPIQHHTTDVDHAPEARIPGDYVLTPLLLAQPASAWISCTICDQHFVQLDAYFTRSACPRCERHSKLYGYKWPKTDKEGIFDFEERVTDHRTIHRFIRSDEERAVRKRVRDVSAGETRSLSREASEVGSEKMETSERRSGRLRSKRSRLTI